MLSKLQRHCPCHCKFNANARKRGNANAVLAYPENVYKYLRAQEAQAVSTMNARLVYLLKETTHLLHRIVPVVHVKGACSRVQQNHILSPIPHAFLQLSLNPAPGFSVAKPCETRQVNVPSKM